jgi:hypothetical protein
MGHDYAGTRRSVAVRSVEHSGAPAPTGIEGDALYGVGLLHAATITLNPR